MINNYHKDIIILVNIFIKIYFLATAGKPVEFLWRWNA